MIMANERLINKDPREDEEDTEETTPFYKSPVFMLVVKISVALGVISSLLTGLIITNYNLSLLKEQVSEFSEQIVSFQSQHEAVTQNVKILTKSHKQLAASIGTLDLTAAKGELSQALTILDTQSAALDKQLAVTRNGLMSLSRMIKGSRVWQEDYKGQYQSLFSDNAKIKASIKTLRGIQETPKEPEPKFLEMDF